MVVHLQIPVVIEIRRVKNDSCNIKFFYYSPNEVSTTNTELATRTDLSTKLQTKHKRQPKKNKTKLKKILASKQTHQGFSFYEQDVKNNLLWIYKHSIKRHSSF